MDVKSSDKPLGIGQGQKNFHQSATVKDRMCDTNLMAFCIQEIYIDLWGKDPIFECTARFQINFEL